ncbi:hypothetical protein DFH08DRAFT_1039811 [Mycena albidolilacea]|uniref:Uncharacterized protein n=1 Tax=Mycena albidolilacea TaxID=1033008 RepID=A0AAD7EEM7_9AGAR|nr:hypothetical protein DFH08DRAFT_1039811 [Mycena albidolilacea]
MQQETRDLHERQGGSELKLEMVLKGKVEGSAIPDGSVPRVWQRLLLLASISAGDFLWTHSVPAALRTAPSEATYSHSSQSRRHIVRRAGSANGAAVVFSIAMKSEVQDTVCDASPTTTRSVLSNVLLHRSISCSVLGAFRTLKNQHAAPPTCPSFVRVWRSAQCPNARLLTTFIQHGARLRCAVSPLPAALLDPAAPALTVTWSVNPWMQQKTAHTAFPRLQDRERWLLSVPNLPSPLLVSSAFWRVIPVPRHLLVIVPPRARIAVPVRTRAQGTCVSMLTITTPYLLCRASVGAASGTGNKKAIAPPVNHSQPRKIYRTKPVDESQRQELGARFLPSHAFLIRCISSPRYNYTASRRRSAYAISPLQPSSNNQ